MNTRRTSDEMNIRRKSEEHQMMLLKYITYLLTNQRNKKTIQMNIRRTSNEHQRDNKTNDHQIKDYSQMER